MQAGAPTEERCEVASPRLRFDHQPALDGVRAVSVCLVLAFHAGFGWMSGGYVGVSVFFTLSGYLITSMLLVEWDNHGTIAFGEFFARRLRRLLPASLTCLAAVVVVTLMGGYRNVAGIKSDVIGSVAHVFNWVRIRGGSSYADAFDGSAALASPLEHYWSLAVEEQFYLVWPFAMVALLRRVDRRSIGRVLVASFVVAAGVTPLVATQLDAGFVYWSTPTRLAELLAGAALAAVTLHRPPSAWVGRMVSPSLLVIFVAAIVLPSGSGPAYSGWMGIFAIASVGLILGLQATSRASRVLSARPLVGLGRISYGVYLFHWPVFTWLRQQGWDLTSLPVFVAATAVVVVSAHLSHRWIEQRFLSIRPKPRVTIGGASLVMTSALAIVALVPFSRGFLEPDHRVLDSASASSMGQVDERPLRPVLGDAPPADEADALATTTGPMSGSSMRSASAGVVAEAGAATPDDVAPAGARSDHVEPVDDRAGARTDESITDRELRPLGDRPIRVAVIGDSTAFSVGQALAQWSIEHPGYATVDLVTCDGCGFLLDGTVTSWDSQAYSESSDDLLSRRVPEMVAAIRPDVVVVMSTMSDVADRRWNEAEGVLRPQDQIFRDRLATAYTTLTSDLVEGGVSNVVWIQPPVPIWPGAEVEMTETERWDVQADVIDGVAASDPDMSVDVIDLDAWMLGTGHASDVVFRPDGTHLTERSAAELVERWLAPGLVDIALTAR